MSITVNQTTTGLENQTADGTRSRQMTESDWWSLALLVVVIALMSVPMLRLWVSLTGDYAFHSVFADQMRKKGAPTVPHFVYHAILAGTQVVIEFFTRESRAYTLAELNEVVSSPGTRLDMVIDLGKYYGLSTIITGLLFVELLGVIIWTAIRRSLWGVPWGRRWQGRIVSFLLTLGLLLVAPAAVLVGRDQRMYLGYIGLNVWHSPTMIALRPLAVLTFFYAAALFRDQPSVAGQAQTRHRLFSTALFVAAGAAVTILSTLAKPNYTLCVLPGVALFLPWAWYKRISIRWVPLMLGLVLPALAVLAWQYYFTYQTAGIRKNSVMFAPLLAMSILSPKYLLWKFFLSILFPGLVWLLFLRGVWADRRMVLAWLVFDCGAAWAYLAAESVGPGDGNFTWGVQMALLVLFIESVLFVLRSRLPGTQPLQPAARAVPLAGWRGWWPVAACAAGFLLHVGYGIGYNVRVMNILTSGKPGWW